MVSGKAVRNLYISLYYKFVIYLFSLVYIWLAALAVSTFSHNLIFPLLSSHISRVNATASKHYHLNKPIFCSIPSVAIPCTYKKQLNLLIMKVLSACRHAPFNHCINNIIKASLKHDLLFPFQGQLTSINIIFLTSIIDLVEPKDLDCS